MQPSWPRQVHTLFRDTRATKNTHVVNMRYNLRQSCAKTRDTSSRGRTLRAKATVAQDVSPARKTHSSRLTTHLVPRVVPTDHPAPSVALKFASMGLSLHFWCTHVLLQQARCPEPLNPWSEAQLPSETSVLAAIAVGHLECRERAEHLVGRGHCTQQLLGHRRHESAQEIAAVSSHVHQRAFKSARANFSASQ